MRWEILGAETRGGSRYKWLGRHVVVCFYIHTYIMHVCVHITRHVFWRRGAARSLCFVAPCPIVPFVLIFYRFLFYAKVFAADVVVYVAHVCVCIICIRVCMSRSA